MNRKQIRQVMQLYGKAWEQQDPEILIQCFVPRGSYQESPLRKPINGHNAMKKFWRRTVVMNTKNIKFSLGNYWVSKNGKTGFAEWKCENDHYKRSEKKWRHDLMYGIMVLKMKGKKITYLNEYWNTRST
ncbi:MAG: hypothetical protein IPJ89_03305 [Candidatus Iainarchaeum archaeon]|uniref:SnoaL-like domain-containing protein n=1 Tax=Candidatus Iainarchaeum sp. TaxID=3101447 RepID=A0A7T9DIV1_9ARCH|nr:MAG: hypothetical protein IPJ89_03305 [Candidatus Diapherotrites archaeon]